MRHKVCSSVGLWVRDSDEVRKALGLSVDAPYSDWADEHNPSEYEIALIFVWHYKKNPATGIDDTIYTGNRFRAYIEPKGEVNSAELRYPFTVEQLEILLTTFANSLKGRKDLWMRHGI